MKTLSALVGALVALVAIGPGQAGEPAAEKQLQVTLAVFQGDPLGRREAGTIKVLANPTLRTLDNRPFCFAVGAEVPVIDAANNVQYVALGRSVQGTARSLGEGKVHLDIRLDNTTLGAQVKERVEVHTESSRTLGTFKLGETVKVRWGSGPADQQTWAEVVVTEAKP